MRRGLLALALLCSFVRPAPAAAQPPPDELKALDARVTAFLAAHRGEWHALNVPAADGQALHDLVLRNGCTRALEIGTSTGHSGIWIAWALAHTGGRLVTIEIDERRHAEALGNFEAAGLSAYVDARRGDAHDLVPRLEGPFDFVFIDADKDWYTTYAKAVLPRLETGGVLAAHNVSGSGRRYGQGADYYRYVTSLPDMETTIVNGQLAVSYKRSSRD